MKEQYKDSNLNYYIKVRLTEDGKKLTKNIMWITFMVLLRRLANDR